MRFVLAVVAIAALAAAATPKVSFTAQQAHQGQMLYYEHCAYCHGGDLGGHIGPALAAKDSEIQWEPGSAVYSYMTGHMPVGFSGGLPKQDYIAIMAFLYAAHQYKAGNAPLSEAAIKADMRPLGGGASPAPYYPRPPVP